MTTTTFKIGTTSKNTCPFFNTNYSKILDDIIATNIKETNPYLNGNYDDKSDIISSLLADAKKNSLNFFGADLNKNDKFLKAATFIANYGKKAHTEIPFIIGKTYKLIDGTPICFYDDEIQIGYDLYSYGDFSNIAFLKKLDEPKKNIIINIFNAGSKNIKINII